MARSKQNTAQKILGLATYGMPAPVRQVVTSRWIATLIVIVVFTFAEMLPVIPVIFGLV